MVGISCNHPWSILDSLQIDWFDVRGPYFYGDVTDFLQLLCTKEYEFCFFFIAFK